MQDRRQAHSGVKKLMSKRMKGAGEAVERSKLDPRLVSQDSTVRVSELDMMSACQHRERIQTS